MTPSRLVLPADQFAVTAATWIAEQIGAALAAGGTCSIALCGGSTPKPVFEALATHPIAWRGVSVYFGDERAVPPDHADSNYAMARRALLDRVPLLPAHVHRMEANRPDRDVAAAEYARLLPDALDLLLLGIGPDGHTASLFPHSSALTDRDHGVLAVPAPAPPLTPRVDRMTITPPVIAAARQIGMLVLGADKAAIVARALTGPADPDTLPAQLARRGTWILDVAAASHLQPEDN